jgi:hypothetical protein
MEGKIVPITSKSKRKDNEFYHNECRSILIHWQQESIDSTLPKIKVYICKGKEDLTIKVSSTTSVV